MQQKILHKKFKYVSGIDETEYSKLVYERKEKLELYEQLISEGCSEETALIAIHTSRATYFRWKRNYKMWGLSGLENESKVPNNVRTSTWTRQIEQRICELRRKFPLWGKAKITVRYKLEYHETISESTVGRIIKKLLNKGKVRSVLFYYGKKEVKRRIFNDHAQRWKLGMKATRPGELIQIDHMSVQVPGFGEVKHFNAICPITKWACYQAYQQATSHNAADFLRFIQQEFPYPIISIQVDGGSEFMGVFEQAAKTQGIPLYVLPPRSPEYNCNVERANGTAKYEFYYQYDAHPSLHIIRKNLHKFTHFYNTVRPHHGIGLLTPDQFYQKIVNEAQSHMS